MSAPKAEYARFARSTEGVAKPISAVKKQPPEPLIRELYRKSPRGDVWLPSTSGAFRLLILIRATAAMYSSVTADCDEVYNYWEPLHFLLYGDGFRTWEYSSKYAIRSWVYLFMHAVPARLFGRINPLDKRIAFFAVRLSLATVCATSEARFYRSIVDNIGERVGRYTLIFLAVSAGMYNAGVAFLPSTFSMYFIMLGYSFALEPVGRDRYRTIQMLSCFAISAVLGWPFSVLLALPLLPEHLLLKGKQNALDFGERISRFMMAGLLAVALLVPVILIDSYFYGHPVFAAWNIIHYNLFSSSGGPELYGSEPWTYYFLNNALNFNILLPLALLSGPALLITRFFEPKRLHPAKPGQTSSYILLSIRLAPFYIWLTGLSLQAHKEERFMFPAFPLMCFHAAVTLTLARGWMQEVFVRATKAPFRAARSGLFRIFTGAVISVFSILSVARILALQHYYIAPMRMLFHLQYYELPALAIGTYPALYPSLTISNFSESAEQIDVSILHRNNLTLCYGQEWYRFPSNFLVPDVLRMDFVKSDFDGILPKHFVEPRGEEPSRTRSDITRLSPGGFNDQNREEMDRYVPIESCSYLVDLDFPHRDNVAKHGRYSRDEDAWEQVYCLPFLDAEHSSRLSRALYFPFLDDRNRYGKYCLSKSRHLHLP